MKCKKTTNTNKQPDILFIDDLMILTGTKAHQDATRVLLQDACERLKRGEKMTGHS